MKKNRNTFVDKWHSIYVFIPLFEKPVVLPAEETILEKLSEKFGTVEALSGNQAMPESSGDFKSFVLTDHPVYYEKEKNSYPSQLLLYGPGEFDRDHFDDQIIAQFWQVKDRTAFINRCRYSIMGSNMMAAGLPMMEQYGIIMDYAEAILELFPECIGIYWPHSQNLLTREAFLQSGWRDKKYHFLDGGLNVRFFNIEGTDEMLFDTLGLTPIGLPDLQLHCKNLDPNEAVGFLKNLAAYLYEAGDVIEDGNTVEGPDHGRWTCQREDSMAGPGRMVLDINAGVFAAGDR